MSRVRHQSMAAALALFAITLLAPASSDARGRMDDKDRRRQVLARTVFVMAGVSENGELKPVGGGSGTILTPDGAVLTNHHVVWNAAAGKPFDWVAIGIVTRFDVEPTLSCLANPSKGVLDEPNDLALIKCEADMQGKPWRGNNWPVAEIGSSEELIPGDEIILIGFPGVGGNTISYTTGKVSGFLSQTGGGGRAWIKTDASIGHGNSGGSAVDENGLLVGVPSAFNAGKDGDRIGLVRPLELARDMIKLAQSGWQPGQGGPVGGAKPPPAQGGQPPAQGGQPPAQGGQPPAQPAPPAPSADAVTVIGRVVAVDNNQPIRNAFFVVLKPGVRSSEVTQENVGQKALTVGISNAQGDFRTEAPVPRGARYSIIVFAQGFRPSMADDVLSTEPRGGQPVSDPFQPWSVVQLDRE
jgi:serine protease Do